MLLLSVPDVILNKVLSCLELSDVSVIATLCEYTNSIKKQIYESARYAHIKNKYAVKRLVKYCPKIKHITIHVDMSPDDITLIHKWNLETLVYDLPRDDITLRFKTLKNLEVWNISYFNVTECTELENICAKSYSSEFDFSVFTKLKSIRMKEYAAFAELPTKLPFTELKVRSEVTDEILKLPLDTLHIEIGRSITKSLPILEQTNLKHLGITCQSPDGRFGAEFKRDILMPNLRTLELAFMKVKLRTLKQLKNLTELSLRGCKFKCNEFACEEFKSMPITKLSLEGCEIDFSYLTHLRLKYLSIRECDLTGDVHQLPESLEHLEIIDSDIDIGDISQLRKLHTLILGSTDEENPMRVTNEGLAAISKLPIRVLELRACNLNDNQMTYIADMQINNLNLECNDLSIVGIKKLKRLPLRRLEVSDMPLLDMTLF